MGHPIIYSCNHQNAFMDALLIGTLSPVKITSLTRSDVFGDHAGRWFMDALQMQPIYRMRDGIEKLAKNEQAFEVVRDRLKKKEGILIFSEGNHGNDFFLRPLSKGSSRMALESQEKLSDSDIYVVPVGLNYFHHQRPFHKLTAVFGKAIKVKDYFELYKEHPAKGTNSLKSDISDGMRECLLIPEDSESYESKRKLINRNNESLGFDQLRANLESNSKLTTLNGKRDLLLSLGRAFGIINFLPLLLIQMVLKPIKDIVFYGSIKWAAALILFPFYWIILFTILSLFLGMKVAGIIAVTSFLTLILRQWLIKLSNVSH